jgi:hypothetical protein
VKQLFHILPALLSLLIGIQALLSCSEDIDTVNVNGISSSVLPSSSSFVQSSNGNNSSSSNNSNSSSSKETQLPTPTINLPKSGTYTSADPIIIPAATEQGSVVHCETSGAVPKENSSLKSGSTLNVTKTTILQCAYFKDGKPSSKTILRTYIVGRVPDLPIVSIAVDPDKMFGSNPKGIYKNDYKPGAGCNGSFYSNDSVPINVDFFEKEASLAWSYPAEIRIHGGCSRQWPKKSVMVSFKEKYGQKNLNYPLFPEFPNLTKFKHFMLRNNGNNYDFDYIRDMLMSSLTEGLNIDYQKGRAVVVYYNGEYYGIHNLRERTNGDYFETNYGIDEGLIDLVKVEKLNGTAPEEVSKGSDADYQDIITWLNGVSLTDNNNYKLLEQRIDVDNFTNHFQSRIFYQDCDWPGKNMKRWRSSVASPKWRWLLYDTDHGFGGWGRSCDRCQQTCGTMEYITATNGPSWPNPPHSTLIMRKLLENKNYEYAFINRFSVLLATYFTTDRMNARRTELTNQISSEIPYDQTKWGSKNGNGPVTSMSNFASVRPGEMQTNLKSYFKLGNPVNFTLTVNGNGKIYVHNLLLPKNSVTFNAYSNVPITIKAVGTGFKKWSDENINPERTLNITKDSILTAVF